MTSPLSDGFILHQAQLRYYHYKQSVAGALTFERFFYCVYCLASLALSAVWLEVRKETKRDKISTKTALVEATFT